MAQASYFSCMGCGRVFKSTDYGFAEYGLHNCDEPLERLIVPSYRTILDRLLRR